MTTIVLFGGRSDERHVSVASAQNVARTLGGPLCWFWAPQGAVHDVAVDDLLAHPRPFEIDFHPRRPALWPTLEQALDTLPVDDPVFFIALHGGEGEDGTVQKMMEDRRIRFTGSGSAASAAAFDKERAKEIVRDRVRLPESVTIHTESELDAIDAMLERFDKIVLKPLAGGSSRGLYFLERGQRLDSDLALPYIVEQYIAGRELTVAVADIGSGPLVLPPLEIVLDPGHSFDYFGKYLGKGTREICPANVSEPMREEAQRVALTAHVALGCEGYSRTDVIAADESHVYFLELNTLPGLTTASLVPQQLRAGGIDFRFFLEKQVELARHTRK